MNVDKILFLGMMIILILGMVVGFSFVFGEEYEPKNFVSHYELYLNDENQRVNIWFVPTGDDIPGFLCEDRKTYLYGCTRHFIHPWHADYVYIALDAPAHDRYGYTFLAHELKHVLCNCNWHD